MQTVVEGRAVVVLAEYRCPVCKGLKLKGSFSGIIQIKCRKCKKSCEFVEVK